MRRLVVMCAVLDCALLPSCKRPARLDDDVREGAVDTTSAPAVELADEDDDREEPDGRAGDAVAPRQCEPLASGGKLRGDTSKKIAAEFGGALALGSGTFAVGYLLSGAESRVGVALLDVGESQLAPGSAADTPKSLRTVDLGVAHGPVEPPRLGRQLVSPEDRGVLVGFLDSDATSGTVRLARVDAEAATVKWGAEVRTGRAESDAFAIARAGGSDSGLVVWDRYEATTLRSSLFGLRFDAQSMHAIGREFRLLTPGEDIDAPLLVPTPNGYFLLAQRYVAGPGTERGAGKAFDLGLVDEPPRSLSVFSLGKDGRTIGSSIELLRATTEPFAFDAVGMAGGDLLVALRVGVADDAPPRLVRVGADGSAHEEAIPRVSLGSGVLTLLPTPEGAWLGAHDPGGRAMLLAIGPRGVSPRGFLPEPGWEEVYPLAASGPLVFAARPRGTDVELVVTRCDPAPEPRDKPAAP